MRVKQFTGIPP